MVKRPLGFLTIPGLITGLVVILIVLGAGLAFGGVLFSPGALNAQAGALVGGVASHAEFTGRCSACHAFFWQSATMADRCVVCHTDVAAQQADPLSLHGSLLKKNSHLTCRTCHPDHRGASASLTDLSKADIAHDIFGYSLLAHPKKADSSPFTCGDCHVNAYGSTFDQAVCIDCHQQIKADFMLTHQQVYGNACLACHDGIDTYGHSFDHEKVAFPLTGMHTQLDCATCHKGARNLGDLQSTPQNCNACHAKDDAHKGQLGTDCAACHTTSGWAPATFDHAKSKFPLTGAHTTLECTRCHLHNEFIAIDTACYACHARDDAHDGQLGSLCATCHTTNAWSPSTFDHGKSKFPLAGTHSSLPCSDCHPDKTFAPLDTACYSCHARDDAHNGQFGTSCDACHTTTAWLPASFDHSKSGFPLTGAHTSLPCSACHPNDMFSPLDTTCFSCHARDDDHNGQFGTDCGTCHSTTAWLPASFDHSRIGFPLTGAHASVGCSGCHTGGGFSGLSTICASCHADPAFHAGLFTGMSCDQCHNTSVWVPAQYNQPHPNACTEVACVGHEGATCRDCHTLNLMSATCLKCHDSNNPGDGDD